MDYRRIYEPGGTFFFTLVTYKRKNIFTEPAAITTLRHAFDYVMARHPFTIVANIILPDHIHTIWTMPQDDSDYSTRWRLIKSHFSRKYSSSQYKEPYWQRRFWEHLIRDEKDFSNHIDYIHFNPVKHGLSSSPANWPNSSFLKFVRDGYYDEGWCKDVDGLSDKLSME